MCVKRIALGQTYLLLSVCTYHSTDTSRELYSEWTSHSKSFPTRPKHPSSKDPSSQIYTDYRDKDHVPVVAICVCVFRCQPLWPLLSPHLRYAALGPPEDSSDVKGVHTRGRSVCWSEGRLWLWTSLVRNLPCLSQDELDVSESKL